MDSNPTPITKKLSLKRNSIEVPIVESKPDNETKSEVSNGMPNTKIIKISELTNMDPLKYFSNFLDIPEMVLQHLSGKDVLAASEVSTSWYDFIASLKILMKKIRVVFDRDLEINAQDLIKVQEHGKTYHSYVTSMRDLMQINIVYDDKNNSEDVNLLKNSSRLYQSILIRRRIGHIKNENGNIRTMGDYATNSELDFIYSRAHEWKGVGFINVSFRKRLDLWRLLSAIKSSVEGLCVTEHCGQSFEYSSLETESFEALFFPKLKRLIVTIMSKYLGNTLLGFLVNSVAIEDLVLVDTLGTVHKDIITMMLENNENLSSLTICTHINEIFDDESWKKYKFKLKSLKIGIILRHRELGANFRNVLTSQRDLLEKLSIDINEVDREIFDVIMKMPKLTNLTLSFREFSENGVPITYSTSIFELGLHDYSNAVRLKFLLDSMPKVRNLKLNLIDEDIFKMLKLMKRKFEKLGVCELKGVDIEEVKEIMTENYTSLEIITPLQIHSK